MKPLTAFNLWSWIEQNRHAFEPPVGNKVIWEDSQFTAMIIRGPNARRDFHVDPSDEIFYMLRGDMVLEYMQGGQRQSQVIREGGMLLVPALTPHAPHRPADTWGSRRRGQAPAHADRVPRLVLRALRRAAARGHHARRRYREGSEDRDRALRRERGAANLPPVRPRPAGQATRPSDAALGGRDAERTLGEGIDRARRRRRGHHGRHAAPRAPAHRLRGDVQGAGGVRAGLIGEIGTTWPWTENEKKVVRAAVEAQRQTGAPLMIHPGRDQTAPMQIV